MRNFFLSFIVLFLLFTNSYSTELEIHIKPSLAFKLNDPILWGGSLKSGIKFNRNYVGAEFMMFMSRKERLEIITTEGIRTGASYIKSEGLYGGGISYLRDIYSSNRLTTVSIGGSVGLWLATYRDIDYVYGGYQSPEKVDIYYPSFVSPQVQISIPTSKSTYFVSSLSMPIQFFNEFKIFPIIDLGVRFTL